MAEPARIRPQPEIAPDPRAFDDLASRYDRDFAHRAPGRGLRESVWRLLEPHVGPGLRALDLGCGSGEDAIWLARAGCTVTAMDASPAMLRATLGKAAHGGIADRVAARLVDLNAPEDLGGPFDLVLSNFGALNCATYLAPLGALLRTALAPGGIVAAVVMGRFCVWETLWQGVRPNAAALRRWGGAATATIGDARIPIRYWSPGELAGSLGAGFRVLSLHPVGLFLPPSELFAVVERRPRLLARLIRWERRASSHGALAYLADHHLTILQRPLEDACP